MSFVRRLLAKATASLAPPRFTPLRFPTSGYQTFDNSVILEEERYDDFRRGLFYPMHIGDILASRYQVVGKLGFGSTSTVWLARDMQAHQHVALKVYTRGEDHDDEFKAYQKIWRANSKHPGCRHVRTALDTFTIAREDETHQCVVQKPMWDSFSGIQMKNPARRFTPELLKAGLRQVLLGLDFIHTECKLVHTDISGNNILINIEDESILHDFVNDEVTHPAPCKFIDGKTIYASKGFGLPKVYGMVALSDFGSAVNGEETRHHNAQPDYFRAPEVMIKADWSYPVDIWNVGVLIWDLFEDDFLFKGQEPDGRGYSIRAHLAELISVLGPPPRDLLQRGRRVKEFFDTEGRFIAKVPIPRSSLEDRETSLEGAEKEAFLRIVRGMLQWRPEDRKTAKELLEDPWLCS